MISVKIDTVSVYVEMGTTLVRDGAEPFDFGTITLLNLPTKTPYPDYADVELTINGTVYDLTLQRDLVERIAIGIWKHTITLAENVIKLAEIIPPDRKFDTIGGNKTTYKYHVEELLRSAFYGKTQPYSIASATQTLLDEDADEKEYVGQTLLQALTDIFRTQNAIPTLSKIGVIGHQDLNELNDLITFTNPIAEVIDSDIADYAMGVHAKVKNGTYEADLIAGGTYFPTVTTGITPRSSKTKYKDEDAEWVIDSGIRRFIDVRMRNLDSQAEGTLTQADLTQWIVSKAEWDDLELERTLPDLYQGKYRNNTMYYVEGDNVIQNVGVKYLNDNHLILGEQVIDAVIRSFWYNKNGTDSQYKNQTLAEMELNFYYQPIRDLEIRQERMHNGRVLKNATTLNNQKDSKLELARFGNANKMLVNRSGNDTYQVTMRYNEGDTFFNMYDYDSEMYRIGKIRYLVRHTTCDVTYFLSKNQSNINPNTAANNAISPFTVQGKDVLTNYLISEYIYFGDTLLTNTSQMEETIRAILLNNLQWTTSQNRPLYNAQFTRDNSTYINMSVQKLAMGNTMLFNAQFKSPKTAGYQLVNDTGFLSGKKLKPISYTNTYGEVSFSKVNFMNNVTVVADTHPIGTFESSYQLGSSYLETNLNPNETFGITRALHCISYKENLIIGDYFVSNNNLIKELASNPPLVIEYPQTVKHTIFDKYPKAGSTGSGTLSVDVVNQEYFEVDVDTPNWIICNPNSPYNIYFAYNYDSGIPLTKVYMSLLKDRPDEESL